MDFAKRYKFCTVLFRLREENRRYLQERAENQQVIQLLEMQKNILTKAVSFTLSITTL